ncbi:glycine cleavage complex lipoylprotein [Petrocella atlantisensis]|uniref:Glycine cleavage system H protein n=1 Tax=Petrocella atlantisensis TaxID=2173034 RepID=A0A3P7PS18_9FIRM|nr:glycine cleavage system protein GcvH [Petrocella atlantisensis]MCF8020782.1 glycine cleavage system protein GcvH [Vallitaleaceae bacterium]PKM53026.1 MAG: glycine cleavage system protein H [Firmicutes bacterium HGW-Firmicutes-5]VDN46001.1 glycine cleavage complex lipoylprotein [Petrocella atlantisensis]
MKIVKGLYYSKDHEWIKIEGDRGYIGITDYAQEAMGDIVFIELPDVDESFAAEDNFAVIESVKAAADIYLPIGATVVEVNSKLEDEPELLNKAPFDEHIAIIEGFETDELETLMDADAYEAYCNSLE